jgi:hypothetical protein
VTVILYHLIRIKFGPWKPRILAHKDTKTFFLFFFLNTCGSFLLSRRRRHSPLSHTTQSVPPC